MEVHEARALLGVAASDSWDAVRVSYRHLMRQLHPDHAGPTSTLRAAELNEAYAVLSRAMRARRPNTGRAMQAVHGRGDPAAAPTPPPQVSVHVDDGDTVVVDASPDEAFTRLLEAAHAVGAVSYVDRSCAILEVIVQHQGEACSLVVTLEEGHDGRTEAFCTLESLERVARPAPAAVVRQLAAALRTPWVSPPRG